MIEVTEKALTELKELLAKQENAGKFIRLFFGGVGWGGPRLGMTLDESTEKDEKIETGGISFLVDQSVRDMITQNGNVSIDYSDSFLRKGFTVGFKDASGSCSC